MWIMFQQIAPVDGQEWAVGWFNSSDKSITHISWYYTEDDARVSHHRLTN